MIPPPPRSTPLYSSAASDVYKRQGGEDEVRLQGRDSRVARQRDQISSSQSLPKEPSRSKGEEGLHYLIAGTAWILPRIQPDIYACLDVREDLIQSKRTKAEEHQTHHYVECSARRNIHQGEEGSKEQQPRA